MIHESAPITNSFVSVPADMGHFNCAAFLAGIIAGVLDSAKFVSSAVLLIIFVSFYVCNMRGAYIVCNEYVLSIILSTYLCH